MRSICSRRDNNVLMHASRFSIGVAPLLMLVLHVNCGDDEAPTTGPEDAAVDAGADASLAADSPSAPPDATSEDGAVDASEDAVVEVGPREAGTITDAGFIVT